MPCSLVDVSISEDPVDFVFRLDLKVETADSSKTLVTTYVYQTARHDFLENSNVNKHIPLPEK
jgi:hypothetical protein